jgi:hypothetical protein
MQAPKVPSTFAGQLGLSNLQRSISGLLGSLLMIPVSLQPWLLEPLPSILQPWLLELLPLIDQPELIGILPSNNLAIGLLAVTVIKP